VRTRRLEYLFAGAGLFLTSSALFPLLQGAGDSTLVAPPTDKRLTLASLAVYAIAAFLLFRRGSRVAEIVAGNRFLFGLVGLTCLSTAWSSVPGSTAWRAVAVLLTTILGVYLATSFDVRELATLISWVLFALVAGSLLFAELRPAYGLDHIRGDAWRGLFTTKNELGRIAVLSTAIWIVRLLTGSGRRLVAAGAVGLSLYALDRSGSKTGLLVVLLLAVFLAALPALRAHYSIAIPAAVLLAIAGVLSFQWLAAHSDAALNSVGADSTLTGRSEIWSAVWSMIAAHPWLGYGFGAFWRGFDGPSAQVWAQIGATPPHAHNGVLDLWLDLGLAGVVLAGGSLAVAGGRAARALRGEWSLESVFPAAMLAFLVLFNLTESTFLKQHSMFWVLYVATAVSLARVPAREPVREPVAVAA
jgi:exopolysaccharide production protein ExoQ